MQRMFYYWSCWKNSKTNNKILEHPLPYPDAGADQESIRCDMLGKYIKDAVIVICWAVLAVVFDRWWIALFAFLFI